DPAPKAEPVALAEEPTEPLELVVEENKLSACVEQASDETVDSNILRAKALELTNQAREARGLRLLNASDVLDASSTIWALNGEFTHNRPAGQTLEVYQEDIGVHYTQFGENLGGYSFTCTAEDCTQAGIEALEKIHQLFME